MNVVDSSGWIEFFTEGSNAAVFGEPIDDLDQLIVPSITVVEVFKFVLRGKDETAAFEVIAAMRQGQVIDLDGELALLAGKFGVELGLPLADSVIYATARRSGAVVWTQDSDFQGLPDVEYVAPGA